MLRGVYEVVSQYKLEAISVSDVVPSTGERIKEPPQYPAAKTPITRLIEAVWLRLGAAKVASDRRGYYTAAPK